MRTLRPERPIDPLTLAILKAVSRVAEQCAIDYFIIGATARDIILTHVFNLPTGRATRDVDLAIAVGSWDQFESLKIALRKSGNFSSSGKLQQRLYFRENDRDFGYPMDLVPFGGVEHGPSMVSWPPDMAVVMDVTGYAEVSEAAEQVQLAPGFVVRVASLPGLAVLKIFAWLERGSENAKDAHDLLLIMQTYCDAGNQERLYNDEFAVIERLDYDLRLSGAYLLGKHIAHLARDKTYGKLLLYWKARPMEND